MVDDDEARVSQALADAGGPPELASQLVAITRDRAESLGALLAWISWHTGKEWTAQNWARHCDRVAETTRLLEEFRHRQQRRV